MPKIVDPALQRRDIRRAARRAFARNGVKATGLGRVAAEAGMGRSSLYHYYPDKSSLVRDLARDLLAEEEALFAAALRSAGTPLQRIERLTGGLVDMFASWSAVGWMLFDLHALDTRRFRAFFRRIRADLAALIAEGQQAGEIDARLRPEAASATIIGMLDGLLLQYLLDPQALRTTASLSTELTRMVGKTLRP